MPRCSNWRDSDRFAPRNGRTGRRGPQGTVLIDPRALRLVAVAAELRRQEDDHL